jgi:hypothetical protein
VDLYVAAVLFLGYFFFGRPDFSSLLRHSPKQVWDQGASPRMAAIATALLAALSTWMAGQNVVRVVSLGQQRDRLHVERAAVVSRVQHCAGPVLAESPLIPILAGQSPMLLDPFAFRVVAARSPAVAGDLIARVSQRQFACVVLEEDPVSPRGAGWYRNVHFGWSVIDAILHNYEYRESLGGHRFYTPR